MQNIWHVLHDRLTQCSLGAWPMTTFLSQRRRQTASSSDFASPHATTEETKNLSMRATSRARRKGFWVTILRAPLAGTRLCGVDVGWNCASRVCFCTLSSIPCEGGVYISVPSADADWLLSFTFPPSTSPHTSPQITLWEATVRNCPPVNQCPVSLFRNSSPITWSTWRRQNTMFVPSKLSPVLPVTWWHGVLLPLLCSSTRTWYAPSSWGKPSVPSWRRRGSCPRHVNLHPRGFSITRSHDSDRRDVLTVELVTGDVQLESAPHGDNENWSAREVQDLGHNAMTRTVTVTLLIITSPHAHFPHVLEDTKIHVEFNSHRIHNRCTFFSWHLIHDPCHFLSTLSQCLTSVAFRNAFAMLRAWTTYQTGYTHASYSWFQSGYVRSESAKYLDIPVTRMSSGLSTTLGGFANTSSLAGCEPNFVTKIWNPVKSE